MDNASIHRIWRECQKKLQFEMTAGSYSSYIPRLTPFEYDTDANVYYLIYDDVYFATTLQRRYSGIMGSIISEILDRGTRVEILTPEEAAARQAMLEPQPSAVRPPISEDLPIAANLNTYLNPKYTFSTFVVGTSNRFAHAASIAVAKEPGKAYNPLFIYGGVGLGKTHLMQAIGHSVLERTPDTRIVYISSENFTNELISAIKNNENTEFRNKFRNVDMLMIDDIQFIAGRVQTQEEFFHTFNTLYESGKQIILTSDKQPREIPKLEERLRSRFEWGLIADVQRPDLETRIAILRRKAELENLMVPDSVHQFIAERVDSNIRELEGTLTRVLAYASLAGIPVSVKAVEEALRDVITSRDGPKALTCDTIIMAVAEYYGVTLEDLKGTKRNREVSIPRQIAMMLARELTNLSLPKIGEVFGRDHTTVLHACDKYKAEEATNEKLRTELGDLRRRLTE